MNECTMCSNAQAFRRYNPVISNGRSFTAQSTQRKRRRKKVLPVQSAPPVNWKQLQIMSFRVVSKLFGHLGCSQLFGKAPSVFRVGLSRERHL